MKSKKIEWFLSSIEGLDFLKPDYDTKTNAGVPRSLYGIINNKSWFEIRREGKKKPKYTLFSFPIPNENFTRANNSKKLGEFNSPEAAAVRAQEIIDEFVVTLTDPQT